MPTVAKTDKFPLHQHGSGQWAKKVNGRRVYFGTDKDAALAEWVRVRDYLLGGRLPPPKPAEGLTVPDLLNDYLHNRRQDVDAGELSYRQWSEYHAVAEQVVAAFGRTRAVKDLRPDDFGKLRVKAAKRLGPFALAKFVQVVRTFFRYAAENGHIDRPVLYGTQFEKPSLKTLRLHRAKSPPKMLTPAECRKLIDAAGPTQLRAMILLALNGGLGPTDLSALPRTALTLCPGWLVYPRPKTGVPRSVPLWPETVAALDEAAKTASRAALLADADKMFLTVKGRPWVRFAENGPKGGKAVRVDSLGHEFAKLAKRAGVKVPGGLYVLRHVFRTVADGAKDRVAIDAIMGHADPSIGAVYRESIDDDRLIAVVEHVHRWLFKGGKA